MEQATGERAQGRRVLVRESERALPTFQRRYSFQHANKIIDNAWFSACILHNMLHKYKKLDEMTVGENWVGSTMEELASNVPSQPKFRPCPLDRGAASFLGTRFFVSAWPS